MYFIYSSGSGEHRRASRFFGTLWRAGFLVFVTDFFEFVKGFFGFVKGWILYVTGYFGFVMGFVGFVTGYFGFVTGFVEFVTGFVGDDKVKTARSGDHRRASRSFGTLWRAGGKLH